MFMRGTACCAGGRFCSKVRQLPTDRVERSVNRTRTAGLGAHPIYSKPQQTNKSWLCVGFICERGCRGNDYHSVTTAGAHLSYSPAQAPDTERPASDHHQSDQGRSPVLLFLDKDLWQSLQLATCTVREAAWGELY